jgi:ribosomal protein S18 acetylase RimI-like enzyme
MSTIVPSIRRFQPEDLPHLYTICLRTGDRGRDASATCSHVHLMGDYYAVPYSVHDPELCLILSDELGPCGYVLGTDATPRFLTWFNGTWLPKLRVAYRDLVPRAAAPDAWLVKMLKEDVAAPACVTEFPAHLHLDLLPRIQGRGFGRQLFSSFLELLRERGARGVHVSVARDNERACRFYEHMGMRYLGLDGGAALYGFRFDSPFGRPPPAPSARER